MPYYPASALNGEETKRVNRRSKETEGFAGRRLGFTFAVGKADYREEKVVMGRYDKWPERCGIWYGTGMEC